ncbi:MAG: hypothetical protein ACXWV5_12085 [Flavitalea sp.]
MRSFLVLFLAGFLFTHCSKDDQINQENRETLIANKKWVVVTNLSIDSLNWSTDLTLNLPESHKDDYILFNTDSTYEINDNNILRPDSVSKIIDAGKWHLSSGGTELMRESTVFNSTYPAATIKEISETTLYLETYSPSDRSYIRTRYRKSE